MIAFVRRLDQESRQVMALEWRDLKFIWTNHDRFLQHNKLVIIDHEKNEEDEIH